MPETSTLRKARKDKKEGKSPSTQAGEFVREEVHHVREGKHGARNPKQAIAIGLSKARRAGVKIPSRGKKSTSKSRGQSERKSAKNRPSPKRSRATQGALKREPRSTVSHRALSKQARSTATHRGSTSRKQAARKAVRTKGKSGLRQAARKAARTRKRTA
jgi:hypothetical protein